MLFNSLAFLVFFPIVLGLYWSAQRSCRAQNYLLLAASYVFYGWWDWRFLGLIVFSTIVDFAIGLRLGIETNPRIRKFLLLLSVGVNLGLLGFFKYFNFFIESLTAGLGGIGIEATYTTLDIILPVGISFYTFQTLSYTIDIYRGRMGPTKSLRDFSLFVAFFPQLVAGPIERACMFIPQLERPRRANAGQINSGVFLILWGLFKKIVIADNVGLIANEVFDNSGAFQGLDLVLGSLAFTVQIYCDFSGYSDVARGIARLLGFELMLNFRLPYFATSPSDFWKRWHISLSSWLGDYLYISLGGNRRGTARTYRNLLLTMLLGGLWHGAAWNFVVWGAYHGILLILFRMLVRDNGNMSPAVKILRVGLMFFLTVMGWIAFRSPDMATLFHFLTNAGLGLSAESLQFGFDLFFYSLPLVVMQIWQARTGNLLAPASTTWPFRACIYGALIAGLLVLGMRESVDFIYFQF